MVTGPTRLGKTEWARSLGRHIYMCGMFNLSMWDDRAEYLVIDDINFEFFTPGGRKSLWGAQRELTLSDKYTKKKCINWGKPMIYLCNRDGDFRFALDSKGKDVLSYSEKEWYEENTEIVELTTRLY